MSLLKALGKELYYAEAPVGFFGVNIQTRMFIARLDNGDLWVCSPLILTGALRKELDTLGPVRHILSPNKIHNQGLDSFNEAFPEAALWASPGLAERRPEISFTATLGDEPEQAWAREFDQLTTGGNVFFSEVVFLHRATQSLIVADLIENVNEKTLPSRLGQAAAKALHIYNQPMASPEFRMYTEDADAARESLENIGKWPFEKILLAHGAFIEENAKELFQGVVDHLLAEVSARPSHRKALYRFLATRQ